MRSVLSWQKCELLTKFPNITALSCQHSKKRNTPRSIRSMNETAEISEKIIQSINNVFQKDQLLDEFDIIPQESQSNRSPVHHHPKKIGLESWCVGFLYSHSFRKFILLRSQLQSQINSHIGEGSAFTSSNSTFEIDTYAQMSLEENRRLTKNEKWWKCLELSRVLILLNPDGRVFWNFRREAFQKNFLQLDDELKLVSLVASRKPKCCEGFYYRRWLIKHALSTKMIDRPNFMSIFLREGKAALVSSSKYFSNYHAWDYRLFLLETWLDPAEGIKNGGNNVPENMKLEILAIENEVSETWLSSHISDHCGYHYRQKVLEYILNLKSEEDGKILLTKEIGDNRGLLLFYPGHESLWYHRRFLIKQLISLFRITKKEDNEEILMILNDEKDLVEGITNTGHHHALLTPDKVPSSQNGTLPSESVQLNQSYAEKHLHWLQVTFLHIQ